MVKFEGPDFFHDTPKRIMGSETEYTVQIDRMPDLCTVDAVQLQAIYSCGSNEAWLQNGSRVYYDMPADPLLEYATPECLSAVEVMHHEKAGEYYAGMIAHELTAGSMEFPVFKRAAYCDVYNESGEKLLAEKSAGHHENYSTPLRKARFTKERQALTSYLATRPIWAGAGMVGPRAYLLSQKHSALTYLSTEGSLIGHGLKSTTRLQDDRIEVRSGDGNMSPWAIRTKFAMTSLVLRLLEHGVFPKDCVIDRGVDLQMIAGAAAQDPRRTTPNRTAILTPIDHQRRIATAAVEFANNHKVPDEERQAAQDVLALCDSLSQPLPLAVVAEQLADRVDWAAKLTYLRRQVGVRGVHLDDVNARTLRAVKGDLEWEALGITSPSSRHYTAVGNVADTLAVNAALVQPPATRAQLRTEYAQFGGETAEAIYWTFVTPSGPYPSMSLDSPYLQHLKPARRQLKRLRHLVSGENMYRD
jgi:hypothetical protein